MAENLDGIDIESTPGPAPKKAKIDDFFITLNKHTAAYVVAHMAASDGISINTIVKSLEIQEGLSARKLSGSADSFYLVRKGITDTTTKVRELIRSAIKVQKSQGSRFAITLDEWTAPGNSRYLNLNIHNQSTFYNLGELLNIRGSLCITN